jgi:hypothetical protein
MKLCALGGGLPFIGAFSRRVVLDVDGEIDALSWKIRPRRGRLKEMYSGFSFFKQSMGGGGGEQPFLSAGFVRWVQWMRCRFRSGAIDLLRLGRGRLPFDWRLAMIRCPVLATGQTDQCLQLMERLSLRKMIKAGWVSTPVWVIRAIAWVRKVDWLQLGISLLGCLSPGVGGLELWYGFHIWDPGGKYGWLGFFVLRRPYPLVWLMNKENVFTLRLSWFGVKDISCSLLAFSFPYKLVEIVLYCFNEFQLIYCTVSTTIECIGEQYCQSFWDEDSLHQPVVVLFFYFQEVREHYVIYQPVRQIMVGVA